MKAILIAASLAALLAAIAVPALAADAHSHGAEAPAHTFTLNHGRKWATDAPLREGMRDIRAALAARHAAVEAGSMNQADYAALGAAIETSVGAIVANCKLPPEADANLHIVVAGLLGAADDLQGKSQTKPAEGLHKAVRAVNLYGRYFDHPGWKPIA